MTLPLILLGNYGGAPVVPIEGSVAYWGSFENSATDGTIAIPTWVAEGDLMIAHDFSIYNTTTTNAVVPPGWTLMGNNHIYNNVVQGSATASVRVTQQYKIAEASDPGSTITFAASTAGVTRKIITVFRPVDGLTITGFDFGTPILGSSPGGGDPAATVITPDFTASHAIAGLSDHYQVTPNPAFDISTPTTSTTNGFSFWSYSEATQIPGSLSYDVSNPDSRTMPGYTGFYANITVSGTPEPFTEKTLQMFGTPLNQSGTAATSWTLTAANVFAGGLVFALVVHTAALPAAPAGWTLISSATDGTNRTGVYCYPSPTSTNVTVAWGASVRGIMWSMRFTDLSPINGLLVLALNQFAAAAGATSKYIPVNKTPSPARNAYAMGVGYHRNDTSVTPIWDGSTLGFNLTGNSSSHTMSFQSIPSAHEGSGGTAYQLSGTTSAQILHMHGLTFRLW